MVNFLRTFEHLEYAIAPELETNLVEAAEEKGADDETKQNYHYLKKRATTLPPETK